MEDDSTAVRVNRQILRRVQKDIVGKVRDEFGVIRFQNMSQAATEALRDFLRKYEPQNDEPNKREKKALEVPA